AATVAMVAPAASGHHHGTVMRASTMVTERAVAAARQAPATGCRPGPNDQSTRGNTRTAGLLTSRCRRAARAAAAGRSWPARPTWRYGDPATPPVRGRAGCGPWG